ncbi:MAG: tryptophan synthase subunit alpha [Cyanobacteria bacterium]|nr:tryptophan synthase subunit alpha [Cyanobacteriota bacterium]
MDTQQMNANRYQKRFQSLKAQHQKAFMPFTVLGWPTPDVSMAILEGMIQGGASMLELGLAFSDPAADGPVIQAAALETLDSGFKVKDSVALIRRIRLVDEEIPIGLLVYYNMVLAQGIDRFFTTMAEAGVDGVLIADLPPENIGEIKEAAQKAGIQIIFIVSTLTTPERLHSILKHAGGFLYVVSRLGITGVDARYDTALPELLKTIAETTDIPTCVGFGISTPDQAHTMTALGADGVITGSQVIQEVNGLRLKQGEPYHERFNASKTGDLVEIDLDLDTVRSTVKHYVASMVAGANGRA